MMVSSMVGSSMAGISRVDNQAIRVGSNSRSTVDSRMGVTSILANSLVDSNRVVRAAWFYWTTRCSSK